MSSSPIPIALLSLPGLEPVHVVVEPVGLAPGLPHVVPVGQGRPDLHVVDVVADLRDQLAQLRGGKKRKKEEYQIDLDR